MKIRPSKKLPPVPPRGYCDLHAHLLPGVDDGAEDLKTAGELLDALAEYGFLSVAATPHTYDAPERAEDVSLGKEARGLAAECARRGLDLVVAAEYYLDFEFHRFLEIKKPLTFKPASPFFLAELPMTPTLDYLDRLSFEIRLRGLRPVLAHPERYLFIPPKRDRFERLRELGFLLQVNLGSLAGIYGPFVRRRARKLLKWGLADLIATDLHSLKQAREMFPRGLIEAVGLVGVEGLDRLMSKNPLAIRDGVYEK